MQFSKDVAPKIPISGWRKLRGILSRLWVSCFVIILFILMFLLILNDWMTFDVHVAKPS